MPTNDPTIEEQAYRRVRELSALLLLAESKAHKRKLKRAYKRAKRIWKISKRGHKPTWQLVMEGVGAVLRGALPVVLLMVPVAAWGQSDIDCTGDSTNCYSDGPARTTFNADKIEKLWLEDGKLYVVRSGGGLVADVQGYMEYRWDEPYREVFSCVRGKIEKTHTIHPIIIPARDRQVVWPDD
jgi:hypothetical protein